jgi:hypothetical protein
MKTVPSSHQLSAKPFRELLMTEIRPREQTRVVCGEATQGNLVSLSLLTRSCGSYVCQVHHESNLQRWHRALRWKLLKMRLSDPCVNPRVFLYCDQGAFTTMLMNTASQVEYEFEATRRACAIRQSLDVLLLRLKTLRRVACPWRSAGHALGHGHGFGN